VFLALFTNVFNSVSFFFALTAVHASSSSSSSPQTGAASSSLVGRRWANGGMLPTICTGFYNLFIYMLKWLKSAFFKGCILINKKKLWFPFIPMDFIRNFIFKKWA
jgi:hypothetical protein